MRRLFAMQWLSRGGSQVYLETMCGWTSDQMVRRYVRSVANEEALKMHERLFG